MQKDVLGTWARVSREILGDLDTEDKNSRERSEAAWPFERNVYGEREEDQKARQAGCSREAIPVGSQPWRNHKLCTD